MLATKPFADGPHQTIMQAQHLAQSADTPTADTDSELVARAQQGCMQAFERLYRDHVGKVRGLIWRISGCSAKTDDLTQETFVLAWRKLGNFRAEAQFSTWLHRIAVNCALADKRGKLQLVTNWDEALPEPRCHSAAPDDDTADVEAAIAALPERARTVLVLSAIYGYQHNEIADMTGMAVGTSKAHLHRARHMLREQLAGQSEPTGTHA